ncbi:ISAs1 family transposase [Xenorhabdus bovienii]|uniref:ISAs1 family transposase n=1 Tax=Xenorhabdus bovienii TaxID=40576 RepID=UPI0023B23B5D|nr:ISAs1 family transposase [Xenorhabdus bovienii]MDE9541272.1 ISAs1 family transposase [Xenorhabdus bovienii]
MKKLVDVFSDFPDPRCQGKIRHRFIDILVIAVCAVIAGANAWTDIEQYGQLKKDWLGSFLPLKGGIPSHDTFRRCFSLLNPRLFERHFYQWVSHDVSSEKRAIIAIDGKSLRHSFDKKIEQSPLHVVSAFSVEKGLSLCQCAVDGKSNEIKAIPTLLSMLSLQGHLVTLDAMGCQRTIAQQLRESGADYILSLKGNQGKTFSEAVNYFQQQQATQKPYLKPDHDEFEDSHGRTVRRRGWVLPLTPETKHLGSWPDIQALLVTETIRQEQYSETVTSYFRYYLSRCQDAPAFQLAAIRKHWAIENSLHWVLDVTFREDDSRMREQIATRIFAQLRKMALNIVKRDTNNKLSLSARRKSAGWDNGYMEALLFNQF